MRVIVFQDRFGKRRIVGFCTPEREALFARTYGPFWPDVKRQLARLSLRLEELRRTSPGACR